MKTYLLTVKSAVLLLVVNLPLFDVVAADAVETSSKTNLSLDQTPVTSEFTEPPPLPPETAALVLSNHTATASEQFLRIGQLDLTPTQKAQALLLILPTLNKDGQRQVAHAAVKHVDDQNYALLRRPLLDGKWNRQVLSVFLTDTLKRPNRIKIPLLLQLARVEPHPMQTEARELLTAYIGQDHGTNWMKWEQSMSMWMAKNPK